MALGRPSSMGLQLGDGGVDAEVRVSETEVHLGEEDLAAVVPRGSHRVVPGELSGGILRPDERRGGMQDHVEPVLVLHATSPSIP